MKNTSKLPPGVKAHKFTRIRDHGTVIKFAADTGTGLQFTLDQIPGFGDITTAYDAYSIDKVDVTFVWNCPYSGALSANAQFPNMVVARDYDDVLAPVTFAEVGEYSDSQLLAFNMSKSRHTITVVPRVAKTYYKAGVSSGYGWGDASAVLDSANIDIPHYGLKWYTNYYSTTYTPQSEIRVYIKYYLTGYASK